MSPPDHLASSPRDSILIILFILVLARSLVRQNSKETLSEEILGKMYAGSSLKPKYPLITPNDLKEL